MGKTTLSLEARTRFLILAWYLDLKNKSTFNYIYKRIFVKFNYFPLGFMSFSFFYIMILGVFSEGAVGECI
ncbi:hypothetical protein DKP78_15280, partial [Enterococcus faecium]